MRTWLCAALITSGTLGAGVLAQGCTSANCTFDATCGEPRDAGTDSGRTFPLNCDPAADPKDDADCVDESIAVFVSTRGLDEGADGSRVKPFRTLAAAAGTLTRQRHRLYLCEGNYPANLVLDATRNGIGIHGGFSCDNWGPVDARPQIEAVNNDLPVLKLTDLGAASLSYLEFSTREPTAAGGSSLAVLANRSTVRFAHVRIAAKKGRAGVDGVLTGLTFPDPSVLEGKPGVAAGGGGETAHNCQSDAQRTVGGRGGSAGAPGVDGTPDLAGGAGGGAGGSATSCGNGFDGTNGPSGRPGEGAKIRGTLSPEGWVAQSGTSGQHGSPGQGGGGGGGRTSGGGGGGGAGGCGGTGGPGGQAGGSSIALASLQSRITLVDSELVADDAAPAGKGVDGQPGQSTRGIGGNRSGDSCVGGNGGLGGKGGAGGGGAGGISVGLLSRGGADHTLDETSKNRIKVGKLGAGGAGGGAGLEGQPGVADGQLVLPE